MSGRPCGRTNDRSNRRTARSKGSCRPCPRSALRTNRRRDHHSRQQSDHHQVGVRAQQGPAPGRSQAAESQRSRQAYAEREKDVLRDLIDQQLLLDKGKDLGITGDTELIKAPRQDAQGYEARFHGRSGEGSHQAGHLLGRLQAEHAQPDHHSESDRRRSQRPSFRQQRRRTEVLRRTQEPRWNSRSTFV